MQAKFTRCIYKICRGAPLSAAGVGWQNFVLPIWRVLRRQARGPFGSINGEFRSPERPPFWPAKKEAKSRLEPTVLRTPYSPLDCVVLIPARGDREDCRSHPGRYALLRWSSPPFCPNEQRLLRWGWAALCFCACYGRAVSLRCAKPIEYHSPPNHRRSP